MHRTLEIIAIGLFAILAAGLGWKLVATLDGWTSTVILALAAVVGYALADLISGIVHWLGDRYGSETTPLIGPIFVRPFREHHLDPKAITRHGFVETNGSNCIVSVPCMAVAFFVIPETPSLFSTFLLGGKLAFCLAIFATNQFHKWAHMDNPPRLVPLLRSISLILTPEHHGIHHSAPFDRNYCITVGWWNPLIHRIFKEANP